MNSKEWGVWFIISIVLLCISVTTNGVLITIAAINIIACMLYGMCKD